jgi:hypothetical protein
MNSARPETETKTIVDLKNSPSRNSDERLATEHRSRGPTVMRHFEPLTISLTAHKYD